MSDVTRILCAIDQGAPTATEQLLPLVDEELRRLAARKLSHKRPGQTLQATALMHETYIRLVDVEQAQHWDSRRHLFAVTAEAMRRIFVKNARRKRSLKAGRDRTRVDLDDAEVTLNQAPDDVLALDDALAKLARENPAENMLQMLDG